ncbi:hypothetical protein [Halalkalibacter urbisdiaboli]|uniref:hypothetical protein n=1 Tax=Halalkalibacter urbisdiaboli TaxID=1960589 RepID=UPI000B42E6B8|nr:hypothetical protein [Halalkalibacter urbisdiaboli]
MHLGQKCKDLLSSASLYVILAERYKYVDPQKHMHFYRLHFNCVMQLEQHYMNLHGHNTHQMIPGQMNL